MRKPYLKPRFIAYLLLSLSLTLTTYVQASQFGNVKFWNVKDLLEENVSTYQLNVRNADGTSEIYATVSRQDLERLYEVKTRIQKSAGTFVDIYLTTGKSPNAFATPITGRLFIAINIPMLKLLSDDPDQMAALIGHEVAHLTEKHIQKNIQASENLQTAMDVIGLIVSGVFGVYGVTNPLAGVGASTAIELLANGTLMTFSRDQEREADAVGLKFAVDSSFNPNGATRLWSKMASLSEDDSFAIFSTHPSSKERVENMRSAIFLSYPQWANKSNIVTQISLSTKIDYSATTHSALASARPTITDKAKRSPSLQEGVSCKLESGEVVILPRISCIQKEGEILK